jgi:hypothetical protein
VYDDDEVARILAAAHEVRGEVRRHLDPVTYGWVHRTIEATVDHLEAGDLATERGRAWAVSAFEESLDRLEEPGPFDITPDGQVAACVDALASLAGAICFADDPAVPAWVHRMQEPADHVLGPLEQMLRLSREQRSEGTDGGGHHELPVG